MRAKGFVLAIALSILGCSSHAGIPEPTARGRSLANPFIVQNGQAPTHWAFLPDLPNPNSQPEDIIVGPDGNIWFSEFDGRIGRYTMSGSLTEFPTPSLNPYLMTSGSDGNIWFIDNSFHTIGRMSQSGVLTTFSPGVGYSLNGLNSGPDGNTWFTAGALNGGYLAEILPSGLIQTLDTSCEPPLIGMGADGSLWAAGNDGFHLQTVTSSGCGTQVQIPGSLPYFGWIMTASGNIWLLLNDGCNPSADVAYFDTISRSFTVYPITLPLLCPGFRFMAQGPDGVLYLSFQSNEIVRLNIKTHKQLSDLHVQRPPDGKIRPPLNMVTGPDGNIWFTEASQKNHVSNALEIYLIRRLTVTPSTITFQNAGQNQLITVGETHYRGNWSAQSSNPAVATVAPSSADTFTVTGTGPGSATITVSDTVSNSFPVSVNVQ